MLRELKKEVLAEKSGGRKGRSVSTTGERLAGETIYFTANSMRMRKLFFGIPIVHKEAAPFLPLFQTISRENNTIPFSPVEKWHITIHFVGDVTEKAYETIRKNFLHQKLPSVSNIILGGNPPLGTFGNSVLFLHVRDDSKTLHRLHDCLAEMVPVRLSLKFRPHVTWGRNPKHVDLQKLVRSHNQRIEKEYIPGQLILYESISKKGKTVYAPLARRKLSFT